jgi:hypothetical protein
MFLKASQLIKNILKIIRVLNSIDILIDTKIRSNQLLVSAFFNNESIIESVKPGEIELVVSFTTYSKRIHDAHLIVESIAGQTIKPNRLVLWLDEGEFSLDTIPELLQRQINRGLEIRFCSNYKSYKKIIPTLQIYPKSNIITVDDDVIYPYDFIEELLEESKNHPDCVVANIVHKMKVNEGTIQPYGKWELNSHCSHPGYDIFPVGAGGVLYPSGVLNNVVLDVDAFTELAPTADDVWLKAMSLLQGKKSKKVGGGRDHSSRFLSIESSQDIGLFQTNLIGLKNDSQIKSVFNKYQIISLLESNDY